jgi:hypothetical protein
MWRLSELAAGLGARGDGDGGAEAHEGRNGKPPRERVEERHDAVSVLSAGGG